MTERENVLVAQTSKSAVSRVSKPAILAQCGHATHFRTPPIWKSAIQQVWKPALPELRLLFKLP